MTDQQKERLHIGWIPAATLTVALIINLIVITRWGAGLEQRLVHLEGTVPALQAATETLREQIGAEGRAGAVVAERIRNIEAGVARIERALEEQEDRE